MKIWYNQSEWSVERINLQEVTLEEKKVLQPVISGRGAVCSVITGKGWSMLNLNTNHEYAFLHLEGRYISILGRGEARRKGGQVLTLWRVCGGCEGGSKAWHPIREEHSAAETQIIHTLDKHVRSRTKARSVQFEKSYPEAINFG